MTGFGPSTYGTSSYGIGDQSQAAQSTTLLVYPKFGAVGTEVIVSGISANIVDKSRNDAFTTPAIDGVKWALLTSGAATVHTGAGLIINLDKSAALASVDLTSQQKWVEGDVSVEYSIIRSNPSIGDNITYMGIELAESPNDIIGIYRLYGPLGHQISVRHMVGGVLIGSGATYVDSLSGVLRIIKIGSIVYATSDSHVLYSSSHAQIGSCNVHLVSGASIGAHMSVRVAQFTSATGILFGDVPATNITFESGRRVVCAAPTQANAVDVAAFNHAGILGTLASAFAYPLVDGVELSSADGVDATVQGDSVLR